MGFGGPFDFIPIWCVFFLTLAIVLLGIEAGFRLGRYRRERSSLEDRPPVGEMVAATLALAAFMLAFTFGLAASRFEVRRELVIKEANAIGTTYLRAGLLPEPDRTGARKLLREYVDVRLAAVEAGKLTDSIRRSEELHTRLWAHAEAAAAKNSNSVMVGLFAGSLNDVIDLHLERVTFGARNRLPATIWVALYFLTIAGTCVVGYHTGLAGQWRSLAMIPLVLGFATVITLIAELDRPQEGLLRVSQQAMIDLRDTLPAASEK
jgi:hypothetical protein